MAKKKSDSPIAAYCWTGEKFVAMPEDLTKHASMTIEEIAQQPEIVWDTETKQWRLK